MTRPSLFRAAAAALPLIALAGLAPAARAQNSIDLIGTIYGDRVDLGTAILSQADHTVFTTLVSGVAQEIALGDLTFEASETTFPGGQEMRLFADLMVNNAVPVTDTFTYDATYRYFAGQNLADVGYSSSSQTYLMPGGGTLLVSVPDGSFGGSQGNRASVPMTATFLYTAPSASAAAPEPGTVALLLSAGIPVVGIVRRRKK